MKRILTIFMIIGTGTSLLMSEDVNYKPTGDFTVYHSKKVSPIMSSSLIESRKLITTRFTTVADCGFACTSALECRTAVYNQLEKICVMYRSNAVLTDNLISSTEDDYVIVADAKSAIPPLLNPPNISIASIWNTRIGSDSQYSSAGVGAGTYWPTQDAGKVFDRNYTTTFCSHGNYTGDIPSTESSGTQTGFFFTHKWGSVRLQSFRLITGPKPPRDPIWISIEGSNKNSSILTRGSSWTLIYNGSSGLDIDPGRQKLGEQRYLWDNINGYASYRFLTLTKRGPERCAEIAEIEFFAL